jgi:hypothetical protein
MMDEPALSLKLSRALRETNQMPPSSAMDAHEVVMHEVDGDCVHVVLDLLPKPLVSRVNRRIPIRVERLARSTWLVGMSARFGSPHTVPLIVPQHPP